MSISELEKQAEIYRTKAMNSKGNGFYLPFLRYCRIMDEIAKAKKKVRATNENI